MSVANASTIRRYAGRCHSEIVGIHSYAASAQVMAVPVGNLIRLASEAESRNVSIL
jgi:hypothetical protein